MFTHRNKKGTNERGALIMEAIAMLGLMTMMSPMIVRQTADHQTEKEEVSVAGQMKTLKAALAAYIAANYEKLKDKSNVEFSQNGQGETIKFSELMSYLPKGYMEYDNGSPDKGKLYGNKLFDSYKIGIRIEDAGEGAKNMIGLILSDHSSDDDDKWIDDRRAARIASMIGADGGYMRSSKTLSALGLAGDEKKKVIGTQGVWEIGDVGDFFSGVNGSAAYDARIAAITTYAGSVSGDFLYRMKEESLPGANSMFTDLDMGSNSGTGCTGPADRCNKITNAGGMEVINGNIVIKGAIRTQTHLDINPSAANIDVTGNIDFGADTSVAFGANESKLNLTASQAVMQANGGMSRLNLDNANAVLNVNTTQLDMNAAAVVLTANNGASMLNMGTFVNETAKTSTNQAALNVSASRLELATVVNTQSNAVIRRDALLQANGGKSRLQLNDTNALLNVGKTMLNINATSAQLLVNNGTDSKLQLNDTNALLNVNTTQLDMTTKKAVLQVNDAASQLQLNDANAFLNTGNTEIDMTAAQAVLRANGSASKLILSSSADLQAKFSSTQLHMDTKFAFLRAGFGVSELGLVQDQAIASVDRMSSAGTSLALNANSASLSVSGSKSRLLLNDTNALLNVNTTHLDMNATSAQLLVNNGTDSKLQLNDTNAVLSVNNDKTMLNMSSSVNEKTRTDQADLKAGSSKLTLVTTTNTTSNAVTSSAAELNSSLSTTLQGNISKALLDNTGIGLNVNNKGKFTLTRTSSAFDINGGTAATNGSLTFNANALTLTQNRAKIVMNSADSKIAAFTGKDSNRGNYLRLAKEGTATEANAPISFYTNSGRVAGSFFQPEKVGVLNNNEWILHNPVMKSARLEFANSNTGETKANLIDIDSLDASVTITVNNGTKGNIAFDDAYTLHELDANYNRFRVDPAFISVMNDIKQTSRGGARLSEALPNYILKGVYTLTNSYSAGPWPCASASDQSCIFTMPYYTKAQLGVVTNGGQEFNCDGWPSDHPLYNDESGACSKDSNENPQYVTFKYYKSTYKTCPDDRYCWAHPFMGVVPAPGHKVSTDDGTEVIYGHEEGVCPDGYVPVLTVTPNAYENGRVLMYKPNSDVIQSAVKYNVSSAGAVNFDNSDVREMTPMIQQGSWVGLVATPIKSQFGYVQKTIGWRVAMGTASLSGNDSFKWNIGGIPAHSLSVTAHTYCYFNPERFTMPNMRFKKLDGTNAGNGATEVILSPMERDKDGSVIE